MVRGGQTGGGERDAQTAFEDYWIDASRSRDGRDLRRARASPSGPEDAGRRADLVLGLADPGGLRRSRCRQAVLLIEAAPGRPGVHRADPADDRGAAAHADRDVRGPPGDRRGRRTGGAWLRVRVTEPARAGLADDVRALLGDRVVEVRIDAPESVARAAARGTSRPEPAGAVRRVPGGGEHRGRPRLVALFARLLDEELAR